jgi:RNA polymerase sigma-70 factor (ECF subfamily)
MKISRLEFEMLAVEQLDAVDRVARSLARNPAEADDLVQETYVRALRAAGSFELQSFGIRPWLFRILHNVHATRAVRESRGPQALADQQLQSIPADTGQRFAAGAFRGADDVESAMQQLSPDLATTLMHWAVDNLSYEQIAEVMDVPIGTVMSRLHRARQKLALSLQSFAPRGGKSGE